MAYDGYEINYSKDRPWASSHIKPLKTKTCYVVGHTLYRTKLSAAKKIAWNWILTKYIPYSRNFPDLQSITNLYGMECECHEDGSEYCLIHSRFNGYFKRLHRKCVIMILSYWEGENI